MIKRNLTNKSLNISQSNLIIKPNQGFNDDLKSLMTTNTPATSYKGIVSKQETVKKTKKYSEETL